MSRLSAKGLGGGLRLRWEGWRGFELDGEVFGTWKKSGIISFSQ